MLKQDLLFEIGCAELPPKSLKRLAEALANNIQLALQKVELSFTTLQFFTTPRRLAIYIKELASLQPERMIERRGPALAAAFDKEGKPTPACQGFAKSCGVSVDELIRQETDKGTWLVFRQLQKGKTVNELMPDLLQQAIAALPIAKPMRWGSSEVEFVRPVHWVVLLYGTDVIPAAILGKQTDRLTYGHRFLHPTALKLNTPADYLTTLRQAYVEPDFAKRQALIREQLLNIAREHDAQVGINESLLDEVTSIVEWPTALLCNFNAKFLAVPKEAIITALESHQKCFMLWNQQANLLPHFITVSNLISREVNQVIKGNERVVTARLADAAFFYQTDCQQPLEQYLNQLKQVVFQEKLGSLFNKAERLAQLCISLAEPLQLNKELAKQTGMLAKTDLMTQMVGEFPELQGIMGYYYAKQEGLPEALALALKEQYLPRFAGDVIPESSLGCALALADRLDSLAGMFAAGEIPTGDKDPFGLRRAAVGLVRILVEKQLPLDLTALLNQALVNYHAYPKLTIKPNLAEQLSVFVLERLRAWYLEQGITADTLQAVFAKQITVPYDIHLRIEAIQAFKALPEAAALAAANKRVSNLLAKQPAQMDFAINEALLQASAERELFKSLQSIRQQVEPLFAQGEYGQAMQQLAGLGKVVDEFFDHVMVMVEDESIKQNRLALLNQLRQLFLQVADISLLQ
ncbi:MAG: glyS [Gammaproteobacteria bacterium]|jgi:glycyl-tRNA synthetase beta chain|nr:glyS [Gammaproteobacteria bacterium]